MEKNEVSNLNESNFDSIKDKLNKKIKCYFVWVLFILLTGIVLIASSASIYIICPYMIKKNIYQVIIVNLKDLNGFI